MPKDEARMVDYTEGNARIASGLNAVPLSEKNQTRRALGRAQSSHNCNRGSVWWSDDNLMG